MLLGAPPYWHMNVCCMMQPQPQTCASPARSHIHSFGFSRGPYGNWGDGYKLQRCGNPPAIAASASPAASSTSSDTPLADTTRSRPEAQHGTAHHKIRFVCQPAIPPSPAALHPSISAAANHSTRLLGLPVVFSGCSHSDPMSLLASLLVSVNTTSQHIK